MPVLFWQVRHDALDFHGFNGVRLYAQFTRLPLWRCFVEAKHGLHLPGLRPDLHPPSPRFKANVYRVVSGVYVVEVDQISPLFAVPLIAQPRALFPPCFA